LYSKDNDLRNNEMINCGLIVYGISPSEYFNNVDTTNTVNGKPIYYYIDKNEITIPQNAGEVILINCNHCTISNLNLSDGTIGIELAYSSNNNITENVLNNNNFAGIYLDSYSEDNSLKINIVKFNNYGIYIQLSNGNFIKKNEINNNYEAVYFYLSNNNIISENNLLNNGFGIHLNHPSNNNRIYNNNFIGNSYPAWDERTNLNNWDNGKKGNYWDDYKELYPDARRRWIKGIWNIPYDIYGGDNQDRYPSIRSFVHTKEKSINLINITLIEWMLAHFFSRN
jgi:parallel beta-helix repeat protein